MKQSDAVTRFVNLCPHEVNLIGTGGSRISFAASGKVARVDVVRTPRTVAVKIAEGLTIDVSITDTQELAVNDMPEPEDNVIYIVSSYVANFLAGKRDDIIAPNTESHSAIRDNEGKVTGVRSFQFYK